MVPTPHATLAIAVLPPFRLSFFYDPNPHAMEGRQQHDDLQGFAMFLTYPTRTLAVDLVEDEENDGFVLNNHRLDDFNCRSIVYHHGCYCCWSIHTPYGHLSELVYVCRLIHVDTPIS